MSLYYHIIYSNPSEAEALCNEYGYQPQSDDEGALALQEISDSSTQGFWDVMNIHPDKEVLMEMFNGNNKKGYHNADGRGLECPGCRMDRAIMPTHTATGTAGTTTDNSVSSAADMQRNNLLVIGIVILAVAAIYIGNKK